MRGAVFMGVMTIFLLSFSSSLPVLEFQNENIRAGETALATITIPEGSFFERIDKDDVKFFEGRKEIFIEHDILYYNETHYLVLFTTREGTFTMEVSKILYQEGGMLRSDTLETQLNITSPVIFSEEENATIKQVITIRPGFIYAASPQTIRVVNTGNATVSVAYGQGEATPLTPAATREITLQPTQEFTLLEISSYKDFAIPVVYVTTQQNVTPTIVKEPDLKPSPDSISADIIIGESEEQTLQLFNFGDENITDLKISLNATFITLANMSGQVLAKEVQNLSINITPQYAGHFEGAINMSYTQYNKTSFFQVPFNIFVLPNGSNETDFNVSAPSCESIGAKSCPEDCDGTGKFIEGGQFCCLGECKAYTATPVESTEESSKSSNGWLIGIIILVVLAGTGFYFWKRYKKAAPPKPREKLKKASEEYTKRVSGTVTKN